jgi:hypothetical protein
MYVPPYSAILRSIGLSRDEVNKRDRVEIPTSLLKFLLQLAAAQSDLDEERYMKENRDVRIAVQKAQIASGLLHYIGYGYFEDRQGVTPTVDEDWYRNKYPDIDGALRDGIVGSPSEHFLLAGAKECRAPNSESEQDAVAWKAALGFV